MTRINKFRAYDGEQMICPVTVSKSGKAFVEVNPKTDSGSVKVIDNKGNQVGYYAEWATYQEFNYPLMQFTGLVDNTKFEDLTIAEQNRWLRDNKMEDWNGIALALSTLSSTNPAPLHIQHCEPTSNILLPI